MLAEILLLTGKEYLEVGVAGVLMAIALAGMAAIPFLAEYFVDDQRDGHDE